MGSVMTMGEHILQMPRDESQWRVCRSRYLDVGSRSNDLCEWVPT